MLYLFQDWHQSIEKNEALMELRLLANSIW